MGENEKEIKRDYSGYTEEELKLYAYEIEHNEPIPLKGRGQKNLYFTTIKPRLDEICDMYSRGSTILEICDRLNIAQQTFYRKVNEHSELRDRLASCTRIRENAVEHSTIKSALGYIKTIKKPMKMKREVFDNGKRVGSEEYIEYVEEEMYIAPDSRTQQFLLKNYMPDKYKDKVETEVKLNITADNINLMSTEQLMSMLEHQQTKKEAIDVEIKEN